MIVRILERIVWRDGSVKYAINTDLAHIRPTMFGLVINEGGPVTVAYENIISRDLVTQARCSVAEAIGSRDRDVTVGLKSWM
jgi:hypothetical protein